MRGRPVGQLLPGAIGQCNALDRVVGQRHLVERARHFAAEQIEVVLSSGICIPVRAGRLRIAIGELPVDAGLRNGHQLELRLLPLANRHRQHDTIPDAGVLAITDQGAAVAQEDPVQHRVRGGGELRARDGRDYHGDRRRMRDDQSLADLSLVPTSRRVKEADLNTLTTQVVEKLWKMRGTAVHARRMKNYFSLVWAQTMRSALC